MSAGKPPGRVVGCTSTPSSVAYPLPSGAPATRAARLLRRLAGVGSREQRVGRTTRNTRDDEPADVGRRYRTSLTDRRVTREIEEDCPGAIFGIVPRAVVFMVISGARRAPTCSVPSSPSIFLPKVLRTGDVRPWRLRQPSCDHAGVNSVGVVGLVIGWLLFELVTSLCFTPRRHRPIWALIAVALGASTMLIEAVWERLVGRVPAGAIGDRR
ncbi:hypothetical protein BH09ACT8_BH09ACT8_14460 [soil metagenome]